MATESKEEPAVDAQMIMARLEKEEGEDSKAEAEKPDVRGDKEPYDTARHAVQMLCFQLMRAITRYCQAGKMSEHPPPRLAAILKKLTPITWGWSKAASARTEVATIRNVLNCHIWCGARAKFIDKELLDIMQNWYKAMVNHRFNPKHCTDGDCSECGILFCPEQCMLHFHHDGCPGGESCEGDTHEALKRWSESAGIAFVSA